MATALTHSFTRKADMMMSTPADQQFGEPWDIFPDPKDPHEKHNDEGRTEFGVFGPMPSNPSKRARYMLLANYLELAGSGATIGGASERERREEEEHFERTVYTHTLQQVEEQISYVRMEIARVDYDLADIRKQIAEHRQNLDALTAQRAETEHKIDETKASLTANSAAAATAVTAIKAEDTQHIADKAAIAKKIQEAEQKRDKEAMELATQNGFRYDPKTHKFYEQREDGTERQVQLYTRPDIMNSLSYIEMDRARLELFYLKEQAGEIDSSYHDRRKLHEAILARTEASITQNTAKIEELQKLAIQQSQEIQLEKQRIEQLTISEAEKVKERDALKAKEAQLLETKASIEQLQALNSGIRDNQSLRSQIQEVRHSRNLTLYANDADKLASENEFYLKYKASSDAVCSVNASAPVDLTFSFNDLQKKLDGTVAGPAVQTAAAGSIDPVNGDTSATARSVADPAKPEERKQEQETAEAATEQATVNQDGTTLPAATQPKKIATNANSGGMT